MLGAGQTRVTAGSVGVLVVCVLRARHARRRVGCALVLARHAAAACDTRCICAIRARLARPAFLLSATRTREDEVSFRAILKHVRVVLLHPVRPRGAGNDILVSRANEPNRARLAPTLRGEDQLSYYITRHALLGCWGICGEELAALRAVNKNILPIRPIPRPGTWNRNRPCTTWTRTHQDARICGRRDGTTHVAADGADRAVCAVPTNRCVILHFVILRIAHAC